MKKLNEKSLFIGKPLSRTELKEIKGGKILPCSGLGAVCVGAGICCDGYFCTTSPAGGYGICEA